MTQEDKIRKEIIDFISVYIKAHGCTGMNKWIAYLEKQGASINVDSILNKVGIKPAYKDGNAWCILYGDNLQDGICGFGDTKEDALVAFIKELLEKQSEYYTKKDIDDAYIEGMVCAKNELEKQSDTNVFDVPKISIKDAIEVTSRMQYIEGDMKPIADFVIDYANWDLHKDEWNQPTLTVPLFRVLDALIQRGKPYCECGQNSEKQGERKP